MFVDISGTLFKPYQFNLEVDFETCVVELADQIFGPDTIYIDKKKRVGKKDILSIPDGYVIDMTEPDHPKLFIVENEIVSHDPFKHIGIQMLKFVTSFEDSRTKVRNFLMDEISKNDGHLKRLEAGCHISKSRNIDNYMDQAVYGEFRGIVVIDEARSELHSVLEKINANISVLELKTFESDSGDRLYQFDTLYDEEEEIKPPPGTTRRPSMTPEAIKARRIRRAECDTVIVPAREEGFKRVFLGEDQWYEIRVGAAMKDRIKYIAAYQVAPVSAVTHIAEVKEIRPYKDTGKYILIFKGPAQEINPIKIKDGKFSPQGPIYAKQEVLLNASHLEEALS
jgi:hypothetical protein